MTISKHTEKVWKWWNAKWSKPTAEIPKLTHPHYIFHNPKHTSEPQGQSPENPGFPRVARHQPSRVVRCWHKRWWILWFSCGMVRWHQRWHHDWKAIHYIWLIFIDYIHVNPHYSYVYIYMNSPWTSVNYMLFVYPRTYKIHIYIS